MFGKRNIVHSETLHDGQQLLIESLDRDHMRMTMGLRSTVVEVELLAKPFGWAIFPDLIVHWESGDPISTEDRRMLVGLLCDVIGSFPERAVQVLYKRDTTQFENITRLNGSML